jgi:DNA-binding NarL/FixJ family response regulator
MNPIRVLLADDHAILRSGLRLLLQREPGIAVWPSWTWGCPV